MKDKKSLIRLTECKCVIASNNEFIYGIALNAYLQDYRIHEDNTLGIKLFFVVFDAIIDDLILDTLGCIDSGLL